MTGAGGLARWAIAIQNQFISETSAGRKIHRVASGIFDGGSLVHGGEMPHSFSMAARGCRSHPLLGGPQAAAIRHEERGDFSAAITAIDSRRTHQAWSSALLQLESSGTDPSVELLVFWVLRCAIRWATETQRDLMEAAVTEGLSSLACDMETARHDCDPQKYRQLISWLAADAVLFSRGLLLPYSQRYLKKELLGLLGDWPAWLYSQLRVWVPARGFQSGPPDELMVRDLVSGGVRRIRRTPAVALWPAPYAMVGRALCVPGEPPWIVPVMVAIPPRRAHQLALLLRYAASDNERLAAFFKVIVVNSPAPNSVMNRGKILHFPLADESGTSILHRE
jgi:hypothetical protein